MNPENERLYGKNTVLEALRAKAELDVIYLDKERAHKGFHVMIASARQAGVPIKFVDEKKLDYLAQGGNHQGVAAIYAAAPYATVEDILAQAQTKGRPPFLVLADGIEDPHNLGALIRTAEAAGADGFIFPKNRSASLTPIIAKTSAGAVHHLPVARVTNLTSEIKKLKKEGIWIYGATMGAQNWCEVDYQGGVGLVIGSEGKGLHRLVEQECDQLVSLPMLGQVNSLNASVAGGILLFEIARQRMGLAAFGKQL